MSNKSKKTIEIEFRSIFDRDKYDQLFNFLSNNAEDLGEDDKDVFFFIMPDKLIKVVNNISRKNAKFVLKLNRIGNGSDFEETEIPLDPEYINDAVKILESINFTDNIMHSFQKRHNYLYKNVELALKYSDVWGYHLELEIVVDNKNKKDSAEKTIREIADELDVRLMSNKELAEFVKNAEEKNRKENIK